MATRGEMRSLASLRVKSYLKDHLPSPTYEFLKSTHRAWQERKQKSVWRSEQIATALQSGEPHLDLPERERFYAELKPCTTYLEYGSGGSTLAALSTVPNVISVENDRAFYRAVTREARSLGRAQYFPIFVDTGRTSEWGLPTAQRLTPLRIQRWRRYVKAPWIVIERNNLFPQFIFVDGRFRVACALESLLRLPGTSDCHILLDDFQQYEGAYFPIFEFVDDMERLGRAVIFRRARNLDEARCRVVLERYYGDFR
jgi:hypothetical protein